MRRRVRAVAGALLALALGAAVSVTLGTRSAAAQARAVAIRDVAPRRAPAPPGAEPWSLRFADAVIRRHPQVHRRWDYTAGVVLGAIERVGLARRDARLLGYVRENVDRFVRPDGSIDTYTVSEFNLDQIAEGHVLFGLAERTRDPRYAKAIALLRDQLRRHPRTAEGGFWHKQIYPEQMWLDGLYMAEPFYARWARTAAPDSAARRAAFDDVARQFLLVARHTRDARTGLMYHAWDAAHAQPWADSTTGVSPNFWARAMGWYMVAAVEVLDELPADHPDRTAVARTLADAAEAIARVQDPVTGLWWDVLDQGNRRGNYLEASASSMFAYALGRGARLGYVDARYREVAERAFDGIVTNLVRTGADGLPSLTNVCEVSGLGGALRPDGSYRDGRYAYYVSEPVVADDYKGVGPFILAALELGR